MRPVTRSELPIGAIISEKYRVTREIGHGGMAAVYEAEHVDIGKRVAVKVLDPALASSATIVERFHREARAAAAVDSPFICDVHDAGRLSDGRPYLVLELLDGESLYDRLCRVERLSPAEVVRVLGQVARGLHKAHAAGIVHRDLKPENIFLSRDGDGQEIAKIVDFGLAKFFGGASATDIRLTREGAIFGTPMYMSPEQVGGQGQADHRSDLWALGCIAFECLTGRPVWKVDQGVPMIFAQIAAAPVPVPSRINPLLPAAFDAWTMRALARAPQDRFQSALEMADSLARSLGQDPALALSAPTLSAPIIIAPGPSVALRPSTPTRSEAQGDDVEPFAPTQPPPPPVATVPLAPAPQPSNPKRAHASRRWPLAILTAALAVGAGVTGFLAVRRSTHRVAAPAASSAAPAMVVSASASSSAAAASVPAAPSRSALPLPPFAAPIAKAQRFLAARQIQAAVQALEQGAASSDNGALLTMLDHVRIAATNTGPCQVTGLGRPRPFDWTSSVRSVAVAAGPSGTTITWIDNQDAKTRWALRSTQVDADLLAMDAPIEVAPSASNIDNATLAAAGDRFLVAFGDDVIGTRGAYLRLLDASAHPTGPVQRLATSRASVAHPSVAGFPDGTIAAVFADAAADGPSDIMAQTFHSDLAARAPAFAVARYAVPSSRQSGSAPSVAVSGDRIVVAWRRENLREHAVVVRALRASDGSVQWPRDDEGVVLTEPKAKVRSLGIACASDYCLLAWRGEPSGAYLAAVDAATGSVGWKKVMSSRATQVGIAMRSDGAGLVSWYDGGRFRVARVTRDGVGEGAVVGQAHGEQATPSVAAAATPGDWLVAWTCFEAGHPEAFVARVACEP
jgi:serine/threonine protein kinase